MGDFLGEMIEESTAKDPDFPKMVEAAGQRRKNPHMGSTLQSFFEERGEWEEVEALAKKKIAKAERKSRKR